MWLLGGGVCVWLLAFLVLQLVTGRDCRSLHPIARYTGLAYGVAALVALLVALLGGNAPPLAVQLGFAAVFAAWLLFELGRSGEAEATR